MINILPLAEPDFEAAGAVLDAAYNGHNLIDALRNNSSFQPSAWLCAWLDDQLVGVVGAIDYGAFASIGMVGTHPNAQRRGVGQQLMTRLVDWLDQRGTTISILDATEMGAPLYEKLGFVDDDRTLRYDRLKHVPLNTMPASVQLIGESDLKEAITFDAGIFGAERAMIIRRAYEQNPQRIFITRDSDGAIDGLLIAQPLTLGPWTARTPHAAECLLQAALTLEYDDQSPAPRAIFPASNVEVMALLERYGFEQSRDLRHMRRGGNVDPRDCRHLFGQTNFMLG